MTTTITGEQRVCSVQFAQVPIIDEGWFFLREHDGWRLHFATGGAMFTWPVQRAHDGRTFEPMSLEGTARRLIEGFLNKVSCKLEDK